MPPLPVSLSSSKSESQSELVLRLVRVLLRFLAVFLLDSGFCSRLSVTKLEPLCVADDKSMSSVSLLSKSVWVEKSVWVGGSVLVSSESGVIWADFLA